MRINSQINIHIIPFCFVESYEDALEHYKTSEFWDPVDPDKEDLNQYVENMISKNEHHETVGVRFKLNKNQNSRRNYNLPDKPNSLIEFYMNSNKNDDKALLEFKVSDIELYLFETKIGFLLLNLELGHNDKTLEMSDYVDFNYYFKKISFSDHWIRFQRVVGFNKTTREKSVECVDLRLKDLITNMIDLEVETYFSDKSSPQYAIPFTSYTTDDSICEKVVVENLFLLRHSFKSTYQIPDSEYNLCANREVYKPFNNIYWGIATEGITSIVIDSDISSTRFSNQMLPQKIRKTYLYMYIIVLYWKYSLDRFNIAAGKLPKRSMDYFSSARDGVRTLNAVHYNQITELRESLIMFKLRSVFRDFTNISHQRKVLEMIESTYSIDKMFAEIDESIEVLEKKVSILIERNEREKEKLREERRYRQEWLITNVTAIFAITESLGSAESISDLSSKVIGYSFDESIHIMGFTTSGYMLYSILILSLYTLVLIGFGVYREKRKIASRQNRMTNTLEYEV